MEGGPAPSSRVEEAHSTTARGGGGDWETTAVSTACPGWKKKTPGWAWAAWAAAGPMFG
jgi:hypothetical protein